MSIEGIISRKEVSSFLERNNWHPVQAIEFGKHSDVLIIEKGNTRYALKLVRDEEDIDSSKKEYRVLKYLNSTPLKPYVPEVGEWLGDIGGFMMEYLEFTTPGETKTERMIPKIARALRLLHEVEYPEIEDIPDDRPDVSGTVCNRLIEMFDLVLNGDDYWIIIPERYRPQLDIVRKYHQVYSAYVPEVRSSLGQFPAVLTHGDLHGGNFMFTPDGKPVFTDWEGARISSPLTDIASFLTYVRWSENDVNRFLELYFGSLTAMETALPCLHGLRKMYLYYVCVACLRWLNIEGEDGLDPVGRAFFNRIITTL
ncbi:MAG TPA: aminoglycoside phosphotransferase family protein [Dehalococcoidia bacterium]|nr:aminoglycoside phosphotransferase family protein [Dehalococcoidia bacterium]